MTKILWFLTWTVAIEAAFGPATPLLGVPSQVSTSENTLTMRVGLSDLGRRQKMNQLLKTVHTNPSPEFVRDELLSEDTASILEKCQWKLRRALLRKIRSAAYAYDIDVDPSFGHPPSKDVREALEQKQGAVRKAERAAHFAQVEQERQTRMAARAEEARKKAHAERAAQFKAEREAAKQAEEERLAAEQKAEEERLAAEAAAQKAEEERLAAEAAAKAEEERLAAEKAAEEERLAAEQQAEEERLAAEAAAQKAEEERLAAEAAAKAEEERLAAEKAAEEERLAAEAAAKKAEEERIAAEAAAKKEEEERIAAEKKAEEERLAAEAAAKAEEEAAAAAEAAAKKAEEEAAAKEPEPVAEKTESAPPASGGAVTTKMIKELRDNTGAGMMDCKKALTECGGDMEEATDFLRKKGLAKADKKASRVAAEGKIAFSSAGNKAVLVEVNCETDFVGKDTNFGGFCDLVAQAAVEVENDSVDALLEKTMADGASVEETRQALVAKIGENIQVRRMASRGGEGSTVGAYVHMNRIGKCHTS